MQIRERPISVVVLASVDPYDFEGVTTGAVGLSRVRVRQMSFGTIGSGWGMIQRVGPALLGCAIGMFGVQSSGFSPHTVPNEVVSNSFIIMWIWVRLIGLAILSGFRFMTGAVVTGAGLRLGATECLPWGSGGGRARVPNHYCAFELPSLEDENG